MKKSVFLFILILTSFFQINSKAQGKDIPLSPEHKRAIIALFKDANTRYFRVDFNSGRETYGARKISATEMEQVRKARAIDNECIRVNVTNGIIIQFGDGTIIAAFTPATRVTQDPFVSLLGKQGADKLSDILSKYFIRDPGD